MSGIEAYNQHANAYDLWFEDNQAAYLSELNAVKSLLPAGKGVEIGAGGGRFAKPLGIVDGVEPSSAMREVAKQRGLNFIDGVAESLPLEDQSFDFALFVTAFCFVDDPEKSLQEVARILKPNGEVLIAFIDKASELGKQYEARKETSKYYKFARFFSCKELQDLLRKQGFEIKEIAQTLFENSDQIQPTRSGCGDGAFVVIKAGKKTG